MNNSRSTVIVYVSVRGLTRVPSEDVTEQRTQKELELMYTQAKQVRKTKHVTTNRQDTQQGKHDAGT